MLNLAIVQLKPRKGAYAENLARLGEVFRRLEENGEPPDLVVLPEAALTGYFVEGGVRELARTAPELVKEAPHQTVVGRMDEARAARQPRLRWTPESKPTPAG